MNRLAHVVNLSLFLLGVLTLVIVVNFFARQEQYRDRIDATKTRAYSLSEQTRQLLANLEGDWKIALIMSQRQTDRAMRRQVDEVLSRYTSASPNISIVRIDPDDPSTLVQYDALLNELNEVYRDAIADYERALNQGLGAFGSLQMFAQQRGGQLEQIAAATGGDDQQKTQFQQRCNLLSLLAEQGNLVTDAVAAARSTDESRPLPDFEAARSILTQALSQWASEIDEIATTLNRLERGADASMRGLISAAAAECRQVSQQLALAADPLKRLPPLELSTIGNQMQKGELAIVLSPSPHGRAAVIPSSQLFPKSNLRKMEDGRTLFDQRFRGEQLISAAIRSLTVDHMPLVVFMHAEEQTLLRPRDKQADLVGVSEILKASRFEVTEWMLSKSAGPAARPSGAKGQPIVWVVIPPPPGRSIEPTAAARALVEATEKLIADGEPVLLSVTPSLMASYGQPDPIASLARPFGIEPQTAEILLETTKVAPGQSQVTIGQAIRDFARDHLIGRAVDGQQTYFGTPVPLKVSGASGQVPAISIIAAIEADPNRWTERDWTSDFSSREPQPAQVLTEPVPLVVAAERPSPRGRGQQRFIAVGSGGWMISNVADVVLDISGGAGRVALINPGNHELMLASVAWLAGMDDLIAASPVSQEISRLRDITPETRTFWMWITVGVLPAVCVLLGAGVWFVRRK